MFQQGNLYVEIYMFQTLYDAKKTPFFFFFLIVDLIGRLIEGVPWVEGAGTGADGTWRGSTKDNLEYFTGTELGISSS